MRTKPARHTSVILPRVALAGSQGDFEHDHH